VRAHAHTYLYTRTHAYTFTYIVSALLHTRKRCYEIYYANRDSCLGFRLWKPAEKRHNVWWKAAK